RSYCTQLNRKLVERLGCLAGFFLRFGGWRGGQRVADVPENLRRRLEITAEDGNSRVVGDFSFQAQPQAHEQEQGQANTLSLIEQRAIADALSVTIACKSEQCFLCLFTLDAGERRR